jgi:hypothetical protein
LLLARVDDASTGYELIPSGLHLEAGLEHLEDCGLYFFGPNRIAVSEVKGA